MRVRHFRDLLRRSHRDNFAPFIASLGPEIDDPIRAFHHLEIVLDHHNRIACIHQPLKNFYEKSDVVEHLMVKLDRIRHKVTCNGVEVDLTPTEFKLLECLVRQPGRAFTRHQLMDAAIGEGAVVLERTIDVHVKTLRKKLADAAKSDEELIETVRGVGYRFKEATEA